MEKGVQKFVDSVKRITDAGTFKQVIIGVVESVDKTNNTCNVLRDHAPALFKVKLNAVIDSEQNFVVVYPAAGSKVLCSIIENDVTEAAVIKCNKVESVLVQIGATRYLVDAAGHGLSRGDNSLKQVLNDFIAEVQKIIVIQGTSPNVAALESIKEKLNNILQ